MGKSPRESVRPNRPWGFLGALALFVLLVSCGPQPSPTPPWRVRTILSAEEVAFFVFLPDGRRIAHTEPGQGMMLLDVATGEAVPVPEHTGTLALDDELLYGEDDLAGVRYYFVGDLRSMASIRLDPLASDALPGTIREAGSIYALKTGPDVYRLLLLQLDPAGNVRAGYYFQGARNLDILLAGIPYKTPPPFPLCPVDEKVPSPDGKYYYYFARGKVAIYSSQGELLNSISSKDLYCYGWAWDSSGVYIQEYKRYLVSHDSGPLELLLAEP